MSLRSQLIITIDLSLKFMKIQHFQFNFLLEIRLRSRSPRFVGVERTRTKRENKIGGNEIFGLPRTAGLPLSDD